MDREKEIKDLIIIGAGPAGLTAGIYAARAKLNAIIFKGKPAGGQLMMALNVDDFPGFPNGISGMELLELMTKQAKKFNLPMIEQEALAVDFKNRPFKITTEDRKNHYAKSVIIATGASQKYLGLEKEKDLIGKGVSFCAICDAAFFNEKEVAVVGGGDVAMEDAVYLSRYAKKVFIILRRGELRASKILQEEAKNIPKIEFIFNSEVIKLLVEKNLEGAVIKNNLTGEEKELKIDGLFLAIGFKPASELFENQLELDEKGYIKTRDCVKTSIEGVFAAGDVCDPNYRQAITAAGLGAMAAIEADKWLRANK